MNDERDSVMIAAEFPLLRHGIAAVVSGIAWLTVCGEAGEPARARQLCAEKKPRLVVLDLDFRNGDGLGLLGDISRLVPNAGILVLSEREDLPFLQRAFRAGAKGYLSKHEGRTEVESGLKWLLMWSECYVSRRISHLILEEVTSGRKPSVTAGMETLSARELAVLQLLGQGEGPSKIARELGIHVKTVETHFRRIKLKLGVNASDELKRRAKLWYLRKGTASSPVDGASAENNID